MKSSLVGLRVLLATLFIGFGAVASAQDAGDPGWFLRAIDSTGTINSFDTHNNALGFGVNSVQDAHVDVINYQNDSRFPDSIQFADTFAEPITEDFTVTGIADVTIPAGNWGIGWGSDDGGQLRIPGVEFATRFNTAGDLQPDDQLIFDGNRGYNTTWGSFSLDAPLETTINVSMWERGGGDNFDVYFLDLEEYGIEADELTDTEADQPSQANLWGLLGVGDFVDDDSWNVRFPETVPGVAIPVSPGQTVNGLAENVESETVGDTLPGLTHYWYDINNPGSYEAVTEFYDFNAGPIQDPAIAAFNPDNTWWTGNQAPLEGGSTEAPKYPAEVIGATRPNAGGTFGDSDNNNYTTAVSGEIRFPRDGEYIFTDGVDDLTVLAIDLDRDGEFSDEEFLINDNAWTNLQRDANDGGFPGEYVPVDIDVPEGCDGDDASDECWFRIEAVFGEGGGTDAGILYWNENSDIEFPTENGDGRVIAAEDIPELAVPEANLRGAGGVVITSANLAAALGSEFPYEFEINEDGTFDSLSVNRTLDVATTSLDLNGATIDLVAVGDLSGLEGEFQLLGADSLTGELTVNVPEGLNVDTSRLATEGIIVFGDAAPGLIGDIDGDGAVAFADFLILSNSFGTDVDPNTSGDLNGDGNVGFPDFLLLSNNFGTSAAAASVPEPAAMTLFGIGALLLGLVRRRRS